MRRVLTVVTLCAMPISVLALEGTASAAVKPAFSAIACSKLNANLSGKTGTISACTDPANTGTKGTFPVASLTSGSGIITWATSPKGTTAVTVSASPNGGTACPAGSTEYAVSGKTGASTGPAKKSIANGAKLHALACVNTTTGAITLVPGTKFTIAA